MGISTTGTTETSTCRLRMWRGEFVDGAQGDRLFLGKVCLSSPRIFFFSFFFFFFSYALPPYSRSLSQCVHFCFIGAIVCVARLGVNEEMAHTSIRFGLGRFTTEEEVDYATEYGEKARPHPSRDVPSLGDGSRGDRH